MDKDKSKMKVYADIRNHAILDPEKKKNQFKEKMQRMAANGGDSNLRIEIQALIRQKVCEGKNKEEILDIIKNDNRFDRYEQFIDGWIEHHISNLQKAKEGKLPARPGYDKKDNLYIKREDDEGR